MNTMRYQLPLFLFPAAVIITGMLLVAGCIQQGTLLSEEEILQKPFRRWTLDECAVLMKNCTSSNEKSMNSIAKVSVVPLTPKFLLAYNWRKVQAHDISESQFAEVTDRQGRNCLGASFEPIGGDFLDRDNAAIREFSQIDSIMIMVTIENIPGTNVDISQFSGSRREIPHIEDRMTLRGGNDILSRPLSVRDDEVRTMTKHESYSVMFPIDEKMKNYLRGHSSVDLCVEIGSAIVAVPISFSF